MSRLATSFVLGYHGCDRAIAEKAIGGDIDILQSTKDFDWLGPGAYFWESDPQRALEWSMWKVSRGDYADPFVIGGVIDLRNCLDLVSREDLELVRSAHSSFVKMQRKAGLPVPKNKSARGEPNADRVLRFLDCAVIRHLHTILESQPVNDRAIEPFDTVRGMFTEGGALYPGGGFKRKNHTQVAVRTSDCIRGLFIPRPYPSA